MWSGGEGAHEGRPYRGLTVNVEARATLRCGHRWNAVGLAVLASGHALPAGHVLAVCVSLHTGSRLRLTVPKRGVRGEE